MVDVRQLRTEDAQSLHQCFVRCYGGSYANDLFYDVDALASAIAQKQLLSVVALHNGEVVGHTGLSIKHPGAVGAEAGNTVVDPAMRGQGLLGKLGGALRDLTVAEGYVGYVHYPTTAHDIMQKAATSGTGRETGLMLDYVPADVDYVDIDAPEGRIAATVVYQPLADCAAEQVFVPAQYSARLERFRDLLDLPRKFLNCTKNTLPDGETAQWDVVHNKKRDLVWVDIVQPGNDLTERLSSLPDAAVTHLDLRMNEDAIEAAVNVLTEMGFRFCAWLPNFAETDVLRLQKLDFAGVATPQLVTDEAKVILEEILAG